MTEVLCGCFSYEKSGRSLENVLTKQSIRFLRQDRDRTLHFQYLDAEFDLPLKANWRGGVLSVRLGETPELFILSGYSIWRRLVYFLLDSLPVLMIRLDNPCSIEIVGLWSNTEWRQAGRISAQVAGFPRSQLENASGRNFSETVPISSKPDRWVVNGQKLQVPVVRLADRDIDAAEMSPPRIEAYLERAQLAPRAQSQTKLIYLETVKEHLHRGEDYELHPYYVYINNECAFRFRAHPYYGADSFFDLALRGEQPGNAGVHQAGSRSFKLSAALREQLFFSSVDLVGLAKSLDGEKAITNSRAANHAYPHSSGTMLCDVSIDKGWCHDREEPQRLVA